MICHCVHTDKTYHFRNNYVGKIYFLWHLLAVELCSCCFWNSLNSTAPVCGETEEVSTVFTMTSWGLDVFSKKVSKKSRIPKVFSGKSLDYSLWFVSLRNLMRGKRKAIKQNLNWQNLVISLFALVFHVTSQVCDTRCAHCMSTGQKVLEFLEKKCIVFFFLKSII